MGNCISPLAADKHFSSFVHSLTDSGFQETAEGLEPRLEQNGKIMTCIAVGDDFLVFLAPRVFLAMKKAVYEKFLVLTEQLMTKNPLFYKSQVDERKISLLFLDFSQMTHLNTNTPAWSIAEINLETSEVRTSQARQHEDVVFVGNSTLFLGQYELSVAAGDERRIVANWEKFPPLDSQFVVQKGNLILMGKTNKKIIFLGDQGSDVSLEEVLQNSTGTPFIARVAGEVEAGTAGESPVLGSLRKSSTTDEHIEVMDCGLLGRVYCCMKSNPLVVVERAASSITVLAVHKEELVVKNLKK